MVCRTEPCKYAMLLRSINWCYVCTVIFSLSAAAAATTKNLQSISLFVCSFHSLFFSFFFNFILCRALFSASLNLDSPFHTHLFHLFFIFFLSSTYYYYIYCIVHSTTRCFYSPSTRTRARRERERKREAAKVVRTTVRYICPFLFLSFHHHRSSHHTHFYSNIISFLLLLHLFVNSVVLSVSSTLPLLRRLLLFQFSKTIFVFV